MVRDVRIKNYTFSIGSLTAASTGLFGVYSDHPINGEILKIFIGSNTWTATGSLQLFPSGTTAENIFTITSGTTTGNVSESRIVYPFVYQVTNLDVQSGAGVNRIVSDPLFLVGSGVGNSTSGLNVTVWYR